MMPGTSAIALLPLDARVAAALSIGNFAALAGSIANLDEAGDDICAVAEAHRALYARTGAEPPWIGYLVQDTRHRGVVGVCGFTDRCRDGRVEIAYFTFPASERRGYAKAMTRALLDIAFGSDEVQRVVAHTRPAENASTAILKLTGFALVGPARDPEDGEVWRWQIVRPASGPRHA